MFTKRFHDKVIYAGRMERLTELVSGCLGGGEKDVLDVGCGDGRIDSYLMQKNKKLRIRGIDVLVRPETYIEVMEYDGYHIPLPDNGVDTVMVIDVLHHTDDPARLMKELARVASSDIIIKDHIRSDFFSYIKLRLMDYVGNAHYHVRLPYHYMTAKQWEQMFLENGLHIKKYQTDLRLYRGIFHHLFDSNLHFIARLQVGKDL